MLFDRLVESATVDNAVNRLWGEVNGRGQNMLGQLLTEFRAELRGELPSATPSSNNGWVTKNVERLRA